MKQNKQVEQIIKDFGVSAMSGYAGKEDWSESLRHVLNLLVTQTRQEAVEEERNRIFDGILEWRRGMSMFSKEVSILEKADVQIRKVLKALSLKKEE